MPGVALLVGDKLAQAPSLTPQLLNIQCRSVPFHIQRPLFTVNNSSLLPSRGKSGLRPGRGPSSLPPSARLTPHICLGSCRYQLEMCHLLRVCCGRGVEGRGSLACLRLAAGRVPDTRLCVIRSGTAAALRLLVPVREAPRPRARPRLLPSAPRSVCPCLSC